MPKLVTTFAVAATLAVAATAQPNVAQAPAPSRGGAAQPTHSRQVGPASPPPRVVHPASPPPRVVYPASPPPRVVYPAVVRGPLRLDDRYHHDHYYPGPGFSVRALPAGSLGLGWRDGNWFFHGGVWFRPVGGRYVVAVPPPGIVVPYLPPAYVSLWIGGVPYYYANGVYYTAGPQGYVVAPPTVDADAARIAPAPPTFIVYPRNGQSAAQADADRASCNDWAGAQAGGNAGPAVFERAFEACMDGRGYTVR